MGECLRNLRVMKAILNTLQIITEATKKTNTFAS